MDDVRDGSIHTGRLYFKVSCGFPRAVELIINLGAFGEIAVPLALRWAYTRLGLRCNACVLSQ